MLVGRLDRLWAVVSIVVVGPLFVVCCSTLQCCNLWLIVLYCIFTVLVRCMYVIVVLSLPRYVCGTFQRATLARAVSTVGVSLHVI